jgi:hypothetical protein
VFASERNTHRNNDRQHRGENADIENLRQTMELDTETIMAEMRSQSMKIRQEIDKKNPRQRRLCMYVFIAIALAAIVGTVVAVAGKEGTGDQINQPDDTSTSDQNVNDVSLCNPFDETLYDARHWQGIALDNNNKFQDTMMLRQFTLEMDAAIINDGTEMNLCELQNGYKDISFHNWLSAPLAAGCKVHRGLNPIGRPILVAVTNLLELERLLISWCPTGNLVSLMLGHYASEFLFNLISGVWNYQSLQWVGGILCVESLCQRQSSRRLELRQGSSLHYGNRRWWSSRRLYSEG